MNPKILRRIAFVVLAVFAFVWFAGAFTYAVLASVRPICHIRDAATGNTPARFISGEEVYQDLDLSPYYMPEYEAVRFPSRDGDITLEAYYVPASEPDAPAVVVTHGNNSCKDAPWTLLAAGMLNRNGYQVVIVDLRNMGNSDDDNGYIGAGHKEGRDLLGVWDWLVEEQGVPPERIGMYGVSLGAASVLSAMSQEPRVAAGFEDSAFSDINKTITDRMKDFGVPTFLGDIPLTIGRWITGDNITQDPILEAIENFDNQPLFIVHSIDDPSIFVEHSYLIQEKLESLGQPVETWYMSGPVHARIILDLPEEYEERVVTFFEAHLKNNESG